MTRFVFHPAFLRAMSLCRYTVYAGVVVALVAAAWRTRTDLSSGVVYLVVAPAVVHALLGWPRLHESGVRWVHGCEAAAGMLCLGWLQAPPGVLAGFALVVFASNTTLWGFFSLPVALTAAGATAGLMLNARTPLVWNAWLDGTALAGALVVVLAICAIAHLQARRMLGRQGELASERRALLRYVPSDLPHHLRDAPGQVRRLWMTVAFVDLVGFTRATQELPAEALSALLNDFLGGLSTQVAAWGGQVAKFLGDGVLCVFPATGPQARGVAAIRCVRGLKGLPGWIDDMNTAWRRQGYLQRFAVTAGVATGYCTVGHWGDGDRLDYSVIGVPVNLACRLQGAAGAHGGLLIDAVTAELIRAELPPGAETELDLKGMAPTRAFMPLPA